MLFEKFSGPAGSDGARRPISPLFLEKAGKLYGRSLAARLTSEKGLLQNQNARGICTRNEKRAMKIGPREKRFCFSRGPIFVYAFL